MTFVQHEVTAEHFSTRTFRARLPLCWVRGEGQPANSLFFILILYLHKVMLNFSVTLMDSWKQLYMTNEFSFLNIISIHSVFSISLSIL